MKSGTFTSKYFLAGAKGPLAPYFKNMLEDPDGMQQLCVRKDVSDEGQTSYALDTELTFSIWNDFVDRTFSYYGFGSEDLKLEIETEIAGLIVKLEKADAESVGPIRIKMAELEAELKQVDTQPDRAEKIFAEHKEQLNDFLSINEVELISHFGTSDRLTGFERDGVNRDKAAVYVDSLRGQVDTIRLDRQKKLAGWTSEVGGIWDSFETQINALAVGAQAERSKMLIHRQFDDVNAFSKWIDKIIPWFDTIVGVLLIIGLFTRFASVAAALFLVSVILTQPPWIPGTQPTYFYFIELFALLVIFALSAGRMGGLDFFFSPQSTPAPRNQTELEAI